MNVLLLGASGFVGSHFLNFLRNNNINVKGTHYNNVRHDTIYFDSLTMNLNDIIEDNIFTIGFILLGETKIDPCKIDQKRSSMLNVHSIIRMLDIMKINNIKPIFISSEYVYKGVSNFKSEDIYCEPETVYGKQKLEVEKYIENHFENHLIIRSPKVIGTTLGDGTLLSNWIPQIKNNEIIKCAIDQFFCATSIEDIVECYYKAAKEGLNGIFNICSKTSYNRKEMLEMLSNSFQLEAYIEEVLINDLDVTDVRPLDLSMNSNKFTDIIPHRFKSIEECSMILANQYKINNEH